MRFLVALTLFFAINVNFAANNLTEKEPEFNSTAANQQFDHINLQLSTQNLNLKNLKKAINTLSALVVQAEQCVEMTQKRLNNINLLIQEGSQAAETNKTAADLVYLEAEQKKLSNKQAQCRLFSIRAKEALEAYQTTVAKLKQAETLTRGLPLWTLINQISKEPFKPILIESFDFSLPNLFYSLSAWVLLISACFGISIFMLYRLHHSKIARRYLRLRVQRLSHIFLLAASLITGIIWIYLYSLSLQEVDIAPLIMQLTQLIFLYFFAIALTVFIFKIKKVSAFFYWYALESHFFRALSIFLISFYILSIAGQTLAQSLKNNTLQWQLEQSIFLFAMLSTAICFIFYFCHAHRHLKFIRHNKRLLQRGFILLMLIFAGINILGFHTLAFRLTFSSFTTFAIIFTTTLIIHGINKFYYSLMHNRTLNLKARAYFGYKKEHTFTEFLILKITFQIIFIAISLYLIVKTWGFATYYIENIYSQFLFGFHFASFTFYPTRIVAGIIIYCLVYLFFRAISTAISRRQQFEDEEETQVAIASIITYLGFGVAMITALLVAGFNFTGLAIIAGALSVGIGLGLQSIVNNFVSGIILLIEKPMKPGDRIRVDTIEGTVKKIRVRSTQLVTAAREDIIVPNSDLITKSVTNYTYSDKQLLISCNVAVAYGSNTKRVQEILLEIANNHDEVIKTGRNKPSVLLQAFGDSNLLFQVGFLIKDANKKSSILSDFNFKIEQLFRENNIHMAYPQQEIHLKLADVKSCAEKLKK